ncbi:MAG TPA: hypothetical protein VN816_00185 [Acidimicrobiales bacterium]|nr:hypothetical protein [Acidimicrobiales bacterium]
MRQDSVVADVDYPGPGAIKAMAAALDAAHAATSIHPGDHVYIDAFHVALAALYSPQWEAVVEGAKRGESWAFAPAVDFLEADPRCFRSGYYKERLCHYLARVDLTPQQRRRLALVTAEVLAESDRPQRELKEWRRLAAAMRDDKHT